MCKSIVKKRKKNNATKEKKVIQKNVSDNKDELSEIFSTLGIEKEHQNNNSLNEKKDIEEINIKETLISNNEPHPDLFKFDQQNSLSVQGYLPSNTIITSNDISADTSAPSNEQTKKKKKKKKNHKDPKSGKVTEKKKRQNPKQISKKMKFKIKKKKT